MAVGEEMPFLLEERLCVLRITHEEVGHHPGNEAFANIRMKMTDVLEERVARMAGGRVLLEPVGDHVLLRRLGCALHRGGEAAHGQIRTADYGREPPR